MTPRRILGTPRTVPVLVVAAISAFLVSGCSGSDSTASRSDVESTLLAFDAPGDGWQPADLIGANLAQSGSDATDWTLLDNGLWRSDDETVTQFAARVTAEDADRVCDEAAAWVSGAGDVLPGDPEGRPQDWMASACRRAFERAAPGDWGPVDHIQGVGVSDGGFQYAAGITVRTTGVQRAVVQVAAGAQPAS